MRLKDFTYDLPSQLIAQYPLAQRSASRLLCLDAVAERIDHRTFSDLPNHINKNDLMVFNNTRVIPARLLGNKETGGKVEILIERLLPENRAIAQIRASKSPMPKTRIKVADEVWITVEGREDDFFLIRSDSGDLHSILEQFGHIPLPPYIERADEAMDYERYQTLYAQRSGAVAAPTAGLHFDDKVLRALEQKGVDKAFVTLHVGAGTFQPVRVDQIEEHRMHSEYLEVDAEVCEKIKATRKRGGRIIAVGTTSVRSLETAAMRAADADAEIQPFFGDTNIFIYPGYQFRCVDAMVTNFHLPESTLLMLVSAFSGRETVLSAYQEAVDNKYRFFSYGDAMFIQNSIAKLKL